MSVLQLYSRGVQRRLHLLRDEANDEGWKAAYQEANGCQLFEHALNSIIEATLLMREMEQEWRSEVYRGVSLSKVEEVQFVHGLLNSLLTIAKETLKTIARFEFKGYQIDRADEFRSIASALEQNLVNWFPPQLSKSPAMRIDDISEEEADELRAISEAPAGSPGKLKISPLVIPDGEPSMLR